MGVDAKESQIVHLLKLRILVVSQLMVKIVVGKMENVIVMIVLI